MFSYRKKNKELFVIEEGTIKYQVGHYECLGKRKTMEDSTVIIGNLPIDSYIYFAIFDGHGGLKASQYAARNVHESFKNHFIANQDSDILKALDQGVQEVNNYLIQQWPSQGSAVGIIIISDEKVYSYNIGDVRAVMVYPDGDVERISHDHRANDPEEEKIIESLGGKVIDDRLQGVFEVSRTLGDGQFKQYICTEPFTSVKERVDGAKIILACDGVWDVMNDQTAAIIAQQNDDPKVAATEIVDQAIRSRTTDNVSCIVINL